MSHEELLAQVPLLASLPPEDLARVASLAKERSFPEATPIVDIGEPGGALCVVLEGTVQVLYPGTGQDLVLAELGPGEFFGEMALLNDEPGSAAYRTVEPVKALLLERQDLRELVRESSDVALDLLEGLSRRIRIADEPMGGANRQVLRDPLTGLLNRRAFHERVAEETERAQRYGEKFSLIIIDLDSFKAVNEALGHEVGDDVLRWIGRLLTEQTRAADAPFRIGGEKFAILAPSAPPEMARTVSERIRAVVNETRLRFGRGVRITVSMGYATCPDHARRAEALFRIADQALLRAKAQGRNRVAGPERTADPVAPPSSRGE